MSGVNDLIAQIDSFLSDDKNKTDKRLMVKLYRQAFPLNEIDENCPGCVLKCWGKLSLLQKNNYSEILNNKYFVMKTEPKKGKYKFAPGYENSEIFIPELHINGLNESDLTDSLGDVLMTYGAKEKGEPGKYAFYLVETNPVPEKKSKTVPETDGK